MKKILIIAAIAVVGIIGANIYVKSLYEEYIRTSEELLMALEEMCEQNNLPWGDTICETDVWEDYCEARKTLGLEYLEHYSKR
jgi:hypothetical protein